MVSPAQHDVETMYSVLKNSENILIVTHYHPDGDAIGSSTALHSVLNLSMGKKADIMFSSPIPGSLAFMTRQSFPDAESSPKEALKAIGEAGTIVCLDCSGLDRTEALREPLRNSRAKKILIDHHLNPSTEDFDIIFSDTEVSSTCELLYRILLQFPLIDNDPAKLPPQTRESLMAGMTTDTNNFANSVFPGTLEMASSLLASGVDRDKILENIYHCHTESRLRLLGYLLSEGMTISPEGVAVMMVDKTLLERYGMCESETEGFVNEPLAIGRVKMSILIKEDNGYFRISVRSKKGVSANRLCHEYFHGGGHEQAAGGKVFWPGDMENKEEILQYTESAAARFMQDELPPISE